MRSLLIFLMGSIIGSPLHAATPSGCQPQVDQVLEALNAWRAKAHVCGGETMAASRALRWSAPLAASAKLFAEELAQRDTVSHEGQVWRTLGKRLRAAGYRMQVAGENLAAGQEDLDDVLEQWMASRDHCENLMLADFQDVGLACVTGRGHYGYFWVLHLGRTSSPESP